jgi:hypothetical protein
VSRIAFQAEYEGQPAEVVVGWDRRLGYYHITIYDLKDEILWDGLEHLGFCRDISTIERHLNSLVTPIPHNTINLVGEREGNVDYRWNENTQTYDRKGYS